jgi:hypothetical protein
MLSLGPSALAGYPLQKPPVGGSARVTVGDLSPAIKNVSRPEGRRLYTDVLQPPRPHPHYTPIHALALPLEWTPGIIEDSEMLPRCANSRERDTRKELLMLRDSTTGRLIKGFARPIQERFWPKVNKANGCWIEELLYPTTRRNAAAQSIALAKYHGWTLLSDGWACSRCAKQREAQP